MKKIVVTTLLIIVIAIAGSIFYVVNNLDELVKSAIEKYGSQATQTSVLVDNVKINLQDGAAAINGMTVANPAGFQAPLVFSLAEVGSQINLASLSEDVIVIDDVRVRAPKVFVEVDKDNKINLNVLKNNIVNMLPQNEAIQEPASEAGASSEVKLIIHRILFEQGFIDARVVSLDNKNFKLNMPSFELNNLGGKSGATVAVITQQILKKLTDIALAEVKKKGIDQQLDKLKAKAKAKIETKKDQLKTKSKQKIDDKKEQAKDKLKNLFGR